MAQILSQYGELFFVGPVQLDAPVVPDLHARVMRRLTGRPYDMSHSFRLAKAYAEAFTRKLVPEKFDVIFAPAASTEIACLETARPIVYTSDVTFARIHDYYPFYSNLQRRSVREANRVEKAALDNARLILYPTEWAAKSARDDYGIDPAKIRVIPYGANLEEIPPRDVALAARPTQPCRLLFLAVDWERKGGGIALETLQRLERLGIEAELVVCGCVPPSPHPRMRVIPFLDKNKPAERQVLTRLLLESTFLLLPTRQECFGIVFCEASAFGLPSVTTDTGGVSGAVRHGDNGILLPVTASGADYAAAIAGLLGDPAAIQRLRATSRQAFEERLNWAVWGAAAGAALQEVV
jgi:glycosyltransferase involved in cell wall biosynthesis